MSRCRTPLAIAFWLLAVTVTGVFVILVVQTHGQLEGSLFAEAPVAVALYALLVLTLPSVGALLAVRVPGTAIAWLLLAAGTAMAAWLTAGLYAEYVLTRRPDLPGGAHAQMVSLALIDVVAVATVLLLFLFPTGRPMSTAWRRVRSVTVGVLLTGMAVRLLSPSASGAVDVENPFALGGRAGQAVAALTSPLEATTPLAFLVAVAAVVVRYRRATGVERAQLKWFAFATGLMVGAFALSFAFSAIGWALAADVGWALSVLALLFVPVAVGIAITRYHLYDIDRLVSRTVTYGAVTLVLAGCYALAVLSLGSLVGRANDLAVAASTLLVAALFGPLRRRVQAGVDRRFNRARYDAQHTVEGFRDQLRADVHLDEVTQHLLSAVGATVQPAAATVWLRAGGKPR